MASMKTVPLPAPMAHNLISTLSAVGNSQDLAGADDIEIHYSGLSGLGVLQERLGCPSLLLEFGEIGIS